MRVLGPLLCLVLAMASTARANPVNPREPRTTEPPAVDPRAGEPPAVDPRAGEPEPAAKKLRELVAKSRDAHDPDADNAQKTRWHAQLDRRLGKPAGPVINIYNTWTHEYLPVDPGTNPAAGAPSAGMVNRFLRCHYTNEPATMAPQLIATLVAAARHFGVYRVDIVSGFRSPKYNLILRKKGREVARNSQHTLGHAVDFRLPGVSVTRLHAWAKSLRLGGVGFYRSSGFVHVDTGRVRYWQGR